MSRRRDERSALTGQTMRLLRDLGPDVDAVRARLEALGVTGTPGSESGCAVARYLNAVMRPDSRLSSVLVGTDAVTVVVERWWARSVVVQLPAAVRSFVFRFDRGDFGSLVATEPRPHIEAARDPGRPLEAT